jgi:hypothetical protein
MSHSMKKLLLNVPKNCSLIQRWRSLKLLRYRFQSHLVQILSLGFSLEEKSQPLQGENLRTQQTSCQLSLQQPCPSLLGSEDGFLPKGEFPILDPKPIV